VAVRQKTLFHRIGFRSIHALIVIQSIAKMMGHLVLNVVLLIMVIMTKYMRNKPKYKNIKFIQFTNEGGKSPFDSFDFLTGLQVGF